MTSQKLAASQRSAFVHKIRTLAHGEQLYPSEYITQLDPVDEEAAAQTFYPSEYSHHVLGVSQTVTLASRVRSFDRGGFSN